MVSLSKDVSLEDAKEMVEEAVSSGRALEKFKEWLVAQGGDVSLIRDSDKLLGAKYKYEIKSQESGYISRLDAEKIGIASMSLGAGRVKKEDAIDPFAGIILSKTYGDYLNEGDKIATLYANDTSLFAGAEKTVLSALSITQVEPQKKTLIYKAVK